MAEILLTNTQLKPEALQLQCGIEPQLITGLGQTNPSIINSYTPYLVGNNKTSSEHTILSSLSPAPVSREVTNLALSYGEENALSISEVMTRLQGLGGELAGTSASIYTSRINGFSMAVKEYQDALMQYRKVMKSRTGINHIARQKVERAFNKMQARFRYELASVETKNKSRRGIPLTNVKRGINIARSGRNAAKLNVASQLQANDLVRYSRYAKFLGTGVTLINFGSGIGNVYNSYKHGGDWERDLFVESSSFTAAALTASIAAKVGASVLGFLMVATPVGWVGLIVGGIVVVGAATAASMVAHNMTREASNKWYDDILAVVN